MKKWKPGIADEPWKVRICKRDMRVVKHTLWRLEYITGLSPEQLKGVSGKEIIEALEAYAETAKRSILKT